MRFSTAVTSASLRTARSPARRWYSHSTSPRSVIQPVETMTSTCSTGTDVSHCSARRGRARPAPALTAEAFVGEIVDGEEFFDLPARLTGGFRDLSHEP